MGQQQRPFVADPTEWEVIDGEDLEVVPDEAPKKPATWADRMGLNKPVPSMPSLGKAEPLAAASAGFMRGVGSGAMDLLQGAASKLVNTFAVDESGTGPNSPAPAPNTMSGNVGSALPDVAMMAMPMDAAAGALPSATRAGAKFQQVMGAAKDIPVDLAEAGNTALRITQLSERGSSMPMAVRKFIAYATDPNKPPMTYEVARDFASNISRLSVDEMKRLQPVVKREIAQMSAQLNKANAEAAKAAGKGAEYKSAMREYANAMRMKDAIDAAIKHSGKAALGAAGLGGAAYLLKD